MWKLVLQCALYGLKSFFLHFHQILHSKHNLINREKYLCCLQHFKMLNQAFWWSVCEKLCLKSVAVQSGFKNQSRVTSLVLSSEPMVENAVLMGQVKSSTQNPSVTRSRLDYGIDGWCDVKCPEGELQVYKTCCFQVWKCPAAWIKLRHYFLQWNYAGAHMAKTKSWFEHHSL